LLGLLLERPGHGGDLANRLLARLGETWRMDAGDIYRLLTGLEEEGLVVCHEEPRRGNPRRTRAVYHATEQTARALTVWMETLLPREPVRRSLQAKLAVAREEDAPRLRLALKEYERECLLLARSISPADGEPRSWAALCVDCTRDGVNGMLQAEVDWANRTLGRIDEYVANRR
jgi:DNA-binding PadR family transcriptional regulator